MADAAQASRENGKLGGRPRSEATLRAQMARDYISKQLADSLPAITAKAITQAIEGDRYAREWLSSYSWGKPAINLGVDESGQPIRLMFDPTFASDEPTDDATAQQAKGDK